MNVVELSSRIALKNILFLTDFSEPSEAALPFAVAIARGYGAKVYTLNAFMPAPYAYTTSELSAAAMEVQEENAKAEMHRVEASFAGLPHESIIERGIGVWPAVQQATREHAIDLVVLGTHGRTGAAKLLLGSVAEEIFRTVECPVLTVGPQANFCPDRSGKFHQVLFATNFSSDSREAAACAVSLALESEAHLTMMHVIR